MSDEFDRSQFARAYIPAPAKPPNFDVSLRLIGGSNPYGEPFLRVGWGMDLRTFRNGNPEAVKYPFGRHVNGERLGIDRWILEKWHEPAFFGTKQEWSRNRYITSRVDGKKLDALGPFPDRGMYGMVMPLTAPDGSYIPCSNDVLVFIDAMRVKFEAQTLNIYMGAKAFAKHQAEMQKEDDQAWAKADEEADEVHDRIAKDWDHINRNPSFSFGKPKTLWTPEGERPI